MATVMSNRRQPRYRAAQAERLEPGENPGGLDPDGMLDPRRNCPVCGDGIRQLGEVCDNGPTADGACCNATCSAFTCVP